MEWGAGWNACEGVGRDQLGVEIKRGHPLHGLGARVIGRCLKCDDVVVTLRCPPGEPELAVVHLTWNRACAPPWPWSERMTTAEFERRFLRGDEHL